MNAVNMIVTSISMSLYTMVLLKVYLDIFLVQKRQYAGVAGWFLFFLWQACMNMEVVNIPPAINLILTLTAIMAVGIISYEGILWKRCTFPILLVMIWRLLEGIGEAGYVYLNYGQEPLFMIDSIFAKLSLLFVVTGIRWFMNRHGGGAYFTL